MDDLPELPKLSEDQIKINELDNIINNMNFLLNPIEFNVWLFKKLNSIEEKLDGKK